MKSFTTEIKATTLFFSVMMLIILYNVLFTLVLVNENPEV